MIITKFFRNLAITIAVVGFLALALHAGSGTQPNVVFVFVDDQGYYDLSCYGATEVNTARVDQLAKEGVRFTDYYV